MTVQNERFGIDVILNDRGFQAGMRRVMQDMRNAEQQTRGLGGAGDGMGKSLAGAFASAGAALAKAGLVAGTAAIAGAFAGAIKTGKDYTFQMSKVEAISGSTSVQMAELGSNARKLGADTRWSATNVAEAYEYMAMAGWNSNQMLDASLPLLNLATAGALDLGKAADIVTDTMTPFGLKAAEAGRVADVFAVAQSKANLNVEMLGETMKYAAPIAATFGASLEDTTVIAMQFANGGIKASMAGTALRAGLSRLAEPPKAASNALKDLGVSTKNADGTMKGLRDIIGEMSPKFQALTNQQQIAAAKAIFGEEAYAGWIMVLKNGLPEFDRMHTLLDESGGAAEAMAGIMANNLSGAVDNASSALENLGLILFSRIEGGLVAATNGSIGFMESLSKSIDPMNNMVEATKLLQTEQMKRAQSEAAIKANLDQGIISQETYNERMAETERLFLENTTSAGIHKQKLAELDAQLQAGDLTQEQYNQKKKEAEQFSLNLGKAVEQEQQKQEELGKKIEWVQGIMKQLWEVVKPVWESISSFIGEQIAKVKKFIDENGKEIESTWNLVWGVIKFFTESIWEGIKDIISGALDIIMGVIKVIGGIMNGDWEKVWEGIKDICGGALDIIWGIVEVGFGKLLKAPLKLGEDLLGWAGKTFKNLGSKIGDYIDDIVKVGGRGWNGFVDDAKRIMGKVTDWVLHPIDNAKRALERISWSSIGRNLIQTLIDGITGMTKWLGSTVSSVGSMLNPLKWFRGADSPYNTGGGMMQSPDGNYAPMMAGGSGAPSLVGYSATGMTGLSKVLDEMGSSLQSLNNISAASASGGNYSRTVAPSGNTATNGGTFVVEVPLHIDGKELARAQAEVNTLEMNNLRERKNLGKGGSKHF
ncbi:phage tail tape measure protein [Bacillus cereus]|uniref:phage tail tape measure protein n=1 Tax=Bacillus cereus TaxID=1396 RepID=UPI0013D771E8|nr:phage tail tape measure protein [Bacillus cereus]